jgi:5-formyltetrahydrofolate cyclo-ligase
LDAPTLRKQVLERLRALSADHDARARQEAQIESRLRLWLAKNTKDGGRIAAYRALPDEVPLDRLLPATQLYGFPRVTDAAQGLMEFRLARLDAPAHWTTGKFGITEPLDSRPLLAPEEIDIVFVPGVAFTRAGARLGRGKGFYDRMLARMPQATKVAVLFSEQWLEAIPAREWDQKVDLLISPDQG